MLRPWRADDVDAYWAAVQDPLLQQWNEAGSPSRDDIAARLARLADWSAGRHASFAVVRGDVLLGSVSLYEIDLAQGEGDIGYWMLLAWLPGMFAGILLERITYRPTGR